MFKSKTNVFLGPVDVANIANSFKELFDKFDIESKFYTYSNKEQTFGYRSGVRVKQFDYKFKIFGKNITSIINLFLKYLFLIYILFKHNTFLFISPHTILPDNKDLRILRYFKKKIVFMFVGCVDRDVNFLKEDPEYICNRCTDFVKQKFCKCDNVKEKANRIQNYEKYSNYILAQDDSAGYLLSKKNIWFHLMAKKPEKKDFLTKFQNERIKIVHFPSNPEIKLSNIIIPVLEKIGKNYPNVEIIIQAKIPHKQVLEELEQTHIVVDALGLSYGMLAIEAMARGCVVIAGDFDFVKQNVSDIAIVGASSNNLYEKIDELVSNRQLLFKKAEDSIRFFNKYHSFDAAGNYYKENLDL